MSGYPSRAEVVAVVKATLARDGHDPATTNITGIVRENFYYNRTMRGWYATSLDPRDWDASVTRHVNYRKATR